MASRLKGRYAAALLPTLFAVAIGLMPAMSRAEGPLVQASQQDPFVACAAGLPVHRSPTLTEPRVAIDPTSIGTDHVHLVGAWQTDYAQFGGTLGLMAGLSRDGGETWTDTPLPFTRCVPGGLENAAAADAWVSIGPDGTVYATGMAMQQDSPSSHTSIVAAISHDGGITWSDAQSIPGSTGYADKESVTADPTRSGVAYVVWHEGTTGNPSYFSMTTDAGKTWNQAQVLVPGTVGMTPGTRPAATETFGHEVLADPRSGTLYVTFVFERPTPSKRVCTTAKEKKHPRGHKSCKTVPGGVANSLAFVSSHNGGQTWSRPHLIAPMHTATQARVDIRGQLPDTTIDPASGRLYAVWEDNRYSTSHYNEIVLSTSKNGGATWSKPVRVSQKGKQAAVPTVAVNRSGVLGITYYTAPTSPPTTGGVPGSYWFVSSADDGVHMSAPVRLAGPFDLTPVAGGGAPGHSPIYFLGDYEGLAAGDEFYPLFAEPRPAGDAHTAEIFSTPPVRGAEHPAASRLPKGR